MIGALLVERGVRQGYTHIRDRDAQRLAADWADDVVLEFPGHSPVAGRYVGKPAVLAWTRRWFAEMDHIHVTVHSVAIARPWALGGTNTVIVQWRVEESFATDGLILRADLVTVYEMVRGKSVSIVNYLRDPDAYDAVWRRHEASLAGHHA